jgi:ketosteroid isomerase-like protein
MGAKLFICLSCTILAGCAKQASDADKSAQSKQEIQALFANWQKAFEAKDVAGSMRMYAAGDQLTAYDVVPPLQYKGFDAYRKDYTDLFAQFAGPLQVELPDMHIDAGSDIAFVYGVERMQGKLANGTPVDLWLRYTEGLKRISGQWRVVHEHISVPVDLNTGKAALDLKP